MTGDTRGGRVDWARAIRALGLSLAASARDAMAPEETLALGCLFLPPSRVAQLGGDTICSGRSSLPSEQFKLRDGAATFRATDLPRILAAAPRLPMEVLLLEPVQLKEWNELKGGFPLQISSYGTNTVQLFGSTLSVQIPAFWPAPMPVARAFTQARSATKQANAPLWLAICVTVTGAVPEAVQNDRYGSIFRPDTGLPQGWAWQFKPGSMTLYADPALSQKLFDFGVGATPAAPIAGAGTLSAEVQKPAEPLPFDDEALLLAALRDIDPQLLPIDWSRAAQARFAKDNDLRQRIDWRHRDAWGVFFMHQPDALSISAFRDWTERRAKALPGTFVFGNIAAYPADGVTPRSIFVFDPHHDASWSASSGLPLQSVRDEDVQRLAAPLAEIGIAPSQIVGLSAHLSGSDLPIIGVLPRARENYQLALPQGVPPQRIADRGDARNGSVMDVEASIDSVQPVRVDNGGRPSTLLVVKLQPIKAQLRIPGDNLVVASVTFAPAPWPGVASRTASSGLRLDSDLLDLLTAKFVGKQLSPEALAYIVLRRWQLENAAGPALAQRFFGVGQKRPSPEEAAALASDYVSWAAAHAPAAPVRVVRTDNVSIRKDRPVGWSAMNSCFAPASMDMSVMSQRGDCDRLQAGQAVAMDKGPNAQRRCAAIDAVVASGDFMQSLFGRCSSANASSGLGLSFVDPLQSRVFIPHTLPYQGVKFLGEEGKFALSVTLDLKKATLSSKPPGATDWLPPEIISAYKPPEARGAGKEFVVFDADFVEASFSDPSGKRLATFGPDQGDSLDQIIKRFADRKQAIDGTAAAATKPPEGPYGPDLLGIQLGMDFAKAEALIRGHMQVGRVLEGRRAYDKEAAQGFNKPLDSGKLFISADGNEMIALIDEPPAVKDRVLAAWRRVLIKRDTVAPSEVFAGIEQRYGKPDGGWKPSQINQWHTPAGALCTNIYTYGKTPPLSEVWYENGQPATNLPGGQGKTPDLPTLLFQPLDPSSEAGGGNCGPFITAFLWTAAMTGRPMDELNMTLSDIGPYLKAYAESWRMLQPGLPTPGTATAGAGSPAPVIKF